MHSPRQTRPHPLLVAVLLPLSLAVGCGAEADAAADRPVDEERPSLDEEGADEPAPGTPRAPVESPLSCVSAPLPAPTRGPPRVMRARLLLQADGTLAATVSEGLQFPHRIGEDRFSRELPPDRTFTLAPVLDGGSVVTAFQTADGEDAALRLTITAGGVFPTVEIVEGAGAVRAEHALNCFGALAVDAAFEDDVRTRALFPARYDHGRDACVDNSGRLALNHPPLWFVQESRQGACADLRGAALNGLDVGYPALPGWDLRGAQLDGATLSFANLTRASLHGANLAGLRFGYAEVSGFIDDQTTLPDPVGPPEEGNSCTVSNDPWAGPQVHCRR